MRWFESGNKLRSCERKEFSPLQSDPATCQLCYHSDKEHAALSTAEAKNIKREVVAEMTSKFGGKM